MARPGAAGKGIGSLLADHATDMIQQSSTTVFPNEQDCKASWREWKPVLLYFFYFGEIK